MAPVRTKKRKSEQSAVNSPHHKVPTKMGTPQRSPIRKRKPALTLAQKQALIDNIQLEITERARRLRAQYHVQAQQLRSRVEMRVNRIPSALRKAKMGELLTKSMNPQPPRAPRSPYVVRPPPVPAKDGSSPRPIPRKPVQSSSPGRGQKRLSEEITGVDKENDGAAGHTKKRTRGAAGAEAVQAGKILSPTSSNTRVIPRPASPAKSMIARPASPTKSLATKSSSNMLSSMVERAKGTRGAAATRNATASSTASSSTGKSTTTTSSTRGRKPAAPAAGPPTTTRGRRKLSATSETSEASNATVVKKTTTSKTTAKAAPATKKGVMSTIKSAATTRKAPAAQATPAATRTVGRTLRKRG